MNKMDHETVDFSDCHGDECAEMGKKELGAIELVPKREFYDYNAKYSKSAQTKHIMPANLSKKKYKEVLKIAKKAHQM